MCVAPYIMNFSSNRPVHYTTHLPPMPILQNKHQIKALSHLALPKFPFLNRFDLLDRRLFCSTFSTILPSKSSNHLFFEFYNNTIYQYTSLIQIFAANRRWLQSVFLFKKLLRWSPVQPDFYLFPPLLKACACLPSLNSGLGIHGFLIKCGFGNWVGVGNSLMLMYSKFGCSRDAYRVFEEMPIRDGNSYNSLVCTLRFNEFYEGLVAIFEEMLELGFSPHLNSVIYAITGYGELGSIEKGMFIYDFVIQNGFDSHVPIVNSLISMYIKMGRLDIGRRVFDDMCCRDVVSWNSLITGYARSGNWVEAFKVFLSMKKSENLAPNQVTFLGLLFACGQATNLGLGRSIHGHLICKGLLSDFHLGTAIVDMYAKCDRIEFARTIFEEELLQKSLVSWNSLIAGYSKNGYDEQAANLFKRMAVESNLKPDSVTLANVIPAYASLADIVSIQSIHALILKNGVDMDGDVVLGTAMVDAYGKCSDMEAAITLFTCIRNPNTATWNALIAGCNLNHLADKSMLLFFEMHQTGVVPDEVTMVMLFQSCGKLESLKQGTMTHGYCLSNGFSSHLIVANAIIDMYMKCGCVSSSELLVSLMSLKNIVTWNTLLFGYVNIGFSSKAIRVFCEMQSDNEYKPDSVTMISIIQAASCVLASQGVEIVHGFILKYGLDSETLVMNSLIDCYAKNGLIEKAEVLFIDMGHLRDQSSWNVMIAGFGMNGQGTEACELFSQMEEEGSKPNCITFTSLLSSCSHSGLIVEGCRYLNMMVTKYKISPALEHLTCVVDMLSRAGRLEEACQLIRLHQISGHDALSNCDAVWGALLSACRVNMDMKLGELAGKKLSELAPNNCGFHTLLSNLYASSKRWDDAVKVRRVFENGRIMKKPGLSLVEM